MHQIDSQAVMKRFLRQVRIFWQAIFLGSVLLYGIAFVHHFTTGTPPHYFSHFSTLDLVSFIIAITLAVAIFGYKRRYFSLRKIRHFLEGLYSREPSLREKDMARRLTRHFGKKMKTVWLMGGALVVLGVIFYWITFTTRNMHIYFIVGIYSLLLNFPRKDLFINVPYLIKEISGKPGPQTNKEGTPWPE